jgi:hypothetical protein
VFGQRTPGVDSTLSERVPFWIGQPLTGLLGVCADPFDQPADVVLVEHDAAVAEACVETGDAAVAVQLGPGHAELRGDVLGRAEDGFGRSTV